MPKRRAAFIYNEPPAATDPHANAPRSAVRAEFAKRLSEAMRRKGYNQSELARRGTALMQQRGLHATMRSGKKAVFSRDNVSNWVRGLALPSPVFLDVMADVLNVKKDWLLPARGVPSVGKSLPKLDLRSTAPGRTFLTVGMDLPTDIAVEIYSRIKKYEQEEKQ